MPRRALALTAATAALFTALSTPAVTAQVDPPHVDLTLAPGGTATVTKNVTTPVVPPNPDIVLLGDTTASMIDVLENVRANAHAITGQILEAAPTAKFAVAEYKHNLDGPKVFKVNQQLTGSPAAVQSATQEWIDSVGGGGIPWTDFINAHYQIATDAIAFRPGSTRIIAWFGDARSENPSLGHTLAQAIGALQAKQIRVIAVPISGTDGEGLDNLGQASAITSQTGGVLMPGSSADAVAQAILSGIKNLDVTVSHKVTECASQLTVSVDPPSQEIQSGQTARFTETIGVKPGTKPGIYRCTVDFPINGVSEGLAQTITVRVPGVKITNASATEGRSATVTVSLDRPSHSPITLQYKTVDGTASAPADYKAAEGEVKFTPGQVRKQIVIDLVEDTVDEPDETFTVTLSQNGSTVGTSTITIKDDDEGGGGSDDTACTATAANVLGKKLVVANPPKTPCKPDSKSSGGSGGSTGSGGSDGSGGSVRSSGPSSTGGKQAAGAKLQAGAISVNVGALNARTGISPKTGEISADASVGGVRIVALGQVVEIGVIASEVSAFCGGEGKPELRGSSKVTSVRIDDIEVPVGSRPITIPLLAGSLKLNSTVKTATSMTQRAVVLDTLLADVVLAESHVACVKKK